MPFLCASSIEKVGGCIHQGVRVTFAAILDGYQRRKDKSVSIRFVTQELSTAEVGNIDTLLDAFGILYFRGEETMNKEEVEELDNLELDLYDQPKKQSQRLRNVLYKVWSQEEVGGEFKDYYKTETERIIQHYKNKLEQ